MRLAVFTSAPICSPSKVDWLQQQVVQRRAQRIPRILQVDSANTRTNTSGLAHSGRARALHRGSSVLDSARMPVSLVQDEDPAPSSLKQTREPRRSPIHPPLPSLLCSGAGAAPQAACRRSPSPGPGGEATAGRAWWCPSWTTASSDGIQRWSPTT